MYARNSNNFESLDERRDQTVLKLFNKLLSKSHILHHISPVFSPIGHVLLPVTKTNCRLTSFFEQASRIFNRNLVRKWFVFLFCFYIWCVNVSLWQLRFEPIKCIYVYINSKNKWFSAIQISQFWIICASRIKRQETWIIFIMYFYRDRIKFICYINQTFLLK